MFAQLTTLAYLDPGTGMFVLQFLLSAAVAIGFFFRGFARSCWRFVTRADKRSTNPNDDSP